MNIYPSFKYQLFTQKMMIIIYYTVFLGMTLLFGGINLISFMVSQTDSSVYIGIGTMNGLSAVTAVMAFVAGCCSFKENFGMAVQNGTSRKSLFLGRLCAAGALCLVLAVCDELFTLLFALIGKLPFLRVEAISMLELMYGTIGGSRFLTVLCAVPFTFFLLLAASAAGYFCTVLFYRLSIPGKVAVGVGAGFVFVFGVPVLKMIRDRFHLEALWEAMCRFMEWFLSMAFGGPANWMISGFAIFCIFSLFAWLLMRKASLKK